MCGGPGREPSWLPSATCANEAPGWDHTCGIYAFKEAGQIRALLIGSAPSVVGRVELSGLVIEHESGYRAERARIVELITPPGLREAVQARYPKVPVVETTESTWPT